MTLRVISNPSCPNPVNGPAATLVGAACTSASVAVMLTEWFFAADAVVGATSAQMAATRPTLRFALLIADLL